VTTKERLEDVEARPTESENQSRRVDTSVKSWGSQAVRMPPELPTESSVEKAERVGGSREAAIKRSTERSFVSCKQTIEGEEREIASHTMGSFLTQPTPCTFHETILISRTALDIGHSTITRERQRRRNRQP
jgi:hypothetical protein